MRPTRPDNQLVADLCSTLAPGSQSTAQQRFAGTVGLIAGDGNETVLADFNGTASPGECAILPLSAEGWQVVLAALPRDSQFAAVAANADGVFKLSTMLLTDMSAGRATSTSRSAVDWNMQHVEGPLRLRLLGNRVSDTDAVAAAARGRHAPPLAHLLILVVLLMALARRSALHR